MPHRSPDEKTVLFIKNGDDLIPFILDPVENNKALRKNWARLIQKIGDCPGEGRES